MSYLGLGLFLALLAGVTYKKPLVGLGVILALLPAYLIRFQIFGFPTTLLELMLVVFLLVVAATKHKNYKRIQNLGKINVVIALFLAAGIISTFVSPEPVRAVGLFKAFILEPLLFFYALILLTNKIQDFELPAKFLFTGSVLVSLFGIIQWFTNLFLPLRFWGTGVEIKRIVSVFEYPNALALYLAPLLVFFIVLKIKKYPLFNNWIFYLGLAVQTIAIIMTFSRGAWLGILIALFAFLVEHFSAKKVLIIAGVALVCLFLISPVRQRLMISTNDASGAARMDLISVAMNKIKQNPIFGNGLYGFRTTLAEQNFKGEILNYPHNILFNFWLEMGILGLISFALIIYYSFRNYQTRRSLFTLAALCAILAIVVHGALDVPYFKNDLSLIFWFLIAILNSK